ncbi:MAG: flavodoxin domain-containing protein [Thalassotalea sp.]
MASFQIIVGSMLGGSEYVAEACQETLESLGHQVTVHLSPKYAEIDHQDQVWLICTSTHGAGDYPDNLIDFISDLESIQDDLNNMPFLVIGLGDSNYDTFCGAAKKIEKLLISKGCNKLLDLKTLDMNDDIDPELVSQQWLIDHKDQLS